MKTTANPGYPAVDPRRPGVGQSGCAWMRHAIRLRWKHARRPHHRIDSSAHSVDRDGFLPLGSTGCIYCVGVLLRSNAG